MPTWKAILNVALKLLTFGKSQGWYDQSGQPLKKPK